MPSDTPTSLRPQPGERWAWPDEHTGRIVQGRVRSIGLYGHATGAAEGVSFSVAGERRRQMVWLSYLTQRGWRCQSSN